MIQLHFLVNIRVDSLFVIIVRFKCKNDELYRRVYSSWIVV